jgi:hypothetical protein
MRVVQAIGGHHRQSRVRARARALCQAWAAHTLKRAIVDVASTSEQDYQVFGFEKAEILEALLQLRAGIESGRRSSRSPRGSGIGRLVIKIATRRLEPSPRTRVSPQPGQPAR